jgi:hypothetical protein
MKLSNFRSVLVKHDYLNKYIRRNNSMQSKSGLIFLIFIFLFTGLRFSFAQQPAQCLAVITEINGDVQLMKASRNELVKALWGTQLFQGDVIKTSAKSGVKLLFSNSTFISLGPNSTISISGKETPATEASGSVKNISSSMMVNLSALTSKRDNKKDVGALAGLRSVNAEQVIELTSPYNSYIKTNRPAFSWLAKKSYDTFIVNLFSNTGLIWSKKVSGNSLKYPDNEKGLEFGGSYFWYVEGEELIDSDKSANQKFSVLTLEKFKEVEEEEKVIRDTFKDEPGSSSYHTVLGACYINQGLLLDAINEFNIVAKMNADAPLPHEILGSLYTDVGNKDKAIEELQTALLLAKSSTE